ncbi:hypothetical protein GCM10018966_000350 [Streptomyces yanii]
MVDYSDKIGASKKQDSSLITPVFDLTGNNSPQLEFDTDYKSFSNQTGNIDVTTDGGCDLDQRLEPHHHPDRAPAHVEVPLTALRREARRAAAVPLHG